MEQMSDWDSNGHNVGAPGLLSSAGPGRLEAA